MSEKSVALDYERWISGKSISGRGYTFLTTIPGMMLINTPVFRFDRELALKPEQRLLDIGCGPGSLLQILSQKMDFARRPVGIDVSPRMLRRARDTGRIVFPGFDLVQGSAIHLPLASDLFDVVTCGYLVKHFDDGELWGFLGEVLRVLKPGGFAVLWEFAPTSSRLLDRWHRWLLTLGVRECNLRDYADLAAASTGAGFDWVESAQLRPFIFPPIPRVSLVVGKAPEPWRERTGLGRVRRAAIEALKAP